MCVIHFGIFCSLVCKDKDRYTDTGIFGMTRGTKCGKITKIDWFINNDGKFSVAVVCCKVRCPKKSLRMENTLCQSYNELCIKNFKSSYTEKLNLIFSNGLHKRLKKKKIDIIQYDRIHKLQYHDIHYLDEPIMSCILIWKYARVANRNSNYFLSLSANFICKIKLKNSYYSNYSKSGHQYSLMSF